MFRSDLTLMYLPAIDPGLGQRVEVLLVADACRALLVE